MSGRESQIATNSSLSVHVAYGGSSAVDCLAPETGLVESGDQLQALLWQAS